VGVEQLLGFILVNGIQGDSHSMLVRLTPNTPLKQGDKIEYTLDVNPKGPVGMLRTPKSTVPATINRQDTRK
jgi:hypothetical protein